MMNSKQANQLKKLAADLEVTLYNFETCSNAPKGGLAVKSAPSYQARAEELERKIRDLLKQAEPALQYRAIKWCRSGDEITPVKEAWSNSREDALKDAFADFAPHVRVFYEIEASDGTRTELTEEEYDEAREWYEDAIAARDARGVWG
jgi:LmbE family N-acetylglucosaminyl deacetylase